MFSGTMTDTNFELLVKANCAATALECATEISILNFWQRPNEQWQHAWCSNVNFEFLAKAKCGHWPALCHATEALSLCLLLPCSEAVDQPWVLCLAAWLASLQSLLLGEIAKNSSILGVCLENTPTTSVLPVITPVYSCVLVPPLRLLTTWYAACVHSSMVWWLIVWLPASLRQFNLIWNPPFYAFLKRDNKVWVECKQWSARSG